MDAAGWFLEEKCFERLEVRKIYANSEAKITGVNNSLEKYRK